jgi:hypothetical protein
MHIVRLLTEYRVPPNLQFQIDDCELDWTFEKESFDYIHIRGLQGSVKDWPGLLTQAYRYVTRTSPCSFYTQFPWVKVFTHINLVQTSQTGWIH